MTQHLVPVLNHLAVSVAAPAILLSDPDGQVRRGGVRGWFVDDVRLLDELTVSVEGSGLDLVRAEVRGADRQEFTYTAREIGGWLHDPQVTLDRRRTLTPAGLVEEIEVASRAQDAFDLVLHVDLVADLAAMADVRQGLATTPVPAERTEDGLAWHHDGHGFAARFDPAPTVGRGGAADLDVVRRARDDVHGAGGARRRGHPGVRSRRHTALGRRHRRGAGHATAPAGGAEPRRPGWPADA